jgi:hypothetical protein
MLNSPEPMSKMFTASALTLLLSGVPAQIITAPALAQAGNFTDITGYWAEQYVRGLAERQIIGGFPDNTFKPNAPITRAQFAAIVVRAFNLGSAGAGSTFVDVPNNYWASGAIRAVSNSGLVTGFPDGTFRPEQQITRAQALVVLTKALGAKATPNPSALERYSDRQAVPDWALDSLSRAANAGIIVSFPNPSIIAPNNVASRGEVAALIYQTIYRMGDRNLPPLTIGTLGQTAVAPPPPAPALSIEIIQTNANPNQPLLGGEDLIVSAFGTPQATASFVIAGINQNNPIPMNEVRPGVYEGRYTIRRSDGQLNTRLAVTLSKQGMTSVTRDFNGTIAINATGTAESIPNTLKPQILNVQNNDAVSFPLELRGQTLPNASVQIVVESINSIAGVINVAQRLFNLSAVANNKGIFNVQLPQASNLASGSLYRIRFTASLDNKSESTELFLKQK